MIDELIFGFHYGGCVSVLALSHRELAERIGSTQSAIARIEEGEAEPKFCILEKLAEAPNRDLHVHIRRPSRHE